MTPQEIIEYFQNSSIEQIALDTKYSRSITQSQSGTESESSKDYVGRVAFEFFQNAVDRADSNIWMELRENEFIIANDGMPFSIYSGIKDDKQSDFYGLNSIHNGTKTAGESIGNKGVGFKSCWNVSDHVIIESKKDNAPWGFELFNPVSVDNFSDSVKIKEAIKDAAGKVPSFYFPKFYESNNDNFHDTAVTKITIKLKGEDAHEEIKRELEEFQKTKFIFLNQLKNKSEKKFDISIKIDGEENIFQSENEDWRIISLKDKNNELHRELKKIRKKQSYKNIPVEPNIAIAFPHFSTENTDDIDSKFYTYLPTKADCGFNILIHADFALDNARISIPDNDYNKKILEIAAKIFVNELLNNDALHKRADFAKFLMPKNKDDKFAQLVWDELRKENKLTEILKKVFTKDRNFQKESYEIIFAVIKKWTKDRAYGAWKDGYYDEIYKETIQYFCHEEIFIVYIDNDNKTFLPPKKEDKGYSSHLFYKSAEDSNNKILEFNLLKGIDTLKISNFQPLSHEGFQKNNIVRKFSTLEILRVLKANESIEIIKFVQQLLENTKEELSEDVKKQLLDLKLPTQKGFVSVKNCYINICTEISNLFSNDFAEVDKKQLGGIDDLDAFLTKIGVANNRLPFADKLPFDKKCDFKLKNPNLIKEFISRSLAFLNDEIIKELKNIEWFYDEFKYDELKKKFYAPKDVFLFKSHDNRKINCIAQERKNNGLSDLYLKFQIAEIDDTDDCEKIINQLVKMKNENIDTNHQDLYKKLTYQLSKVYRDKEIKIPILAIETKTNKIEYLEDTQKVIFLETKHKQYKEQLKESYTYVAYLDTNMSHEFVQKMGIAVFSPDYTIVYEDDQKNPVEPTIDNELKKTLQDEFLAPFFALAEEVLGSSFEKENTIKRWENLTIKTAHNVIFTIKDNSKRIIVASTEDPNIDVLYIPIKDKYNNPTLIGEVAHDLKEPMINSNLRKFAQVFAEGIFRSQKLKSDFELYITGHLNEDDILKNEILTNKGVENNHIESMKSFIKENLLTDDEKTAVVKKLIESNIAIDDYSQIRDFEKYRYLTSSFPDFVSKFDEKYKSIIENLINDYMSYAQSSLLKEIEINKKNLEVLCFMKYKNRDKYEEIYESIKNRKIEGFKNENDIYKHFGVSNIDKNDNDYIEALLDFENFTDEVNHNEIKIEVRKNIITANAKPSTGNAKSKIEHKNIEEKNEKIGLGQELKIAYGFAKSIIDKEAFIETIKKNIFINDENLKDDVNLKIYLKNLEENRDVNYLDFAKNVIQIANHKLDGLGYDLIIPSFDKNNKIEGIKKIELKTTTRRDNIEIHFSHNEIQRILHYMNVDPNFDNWEIWLNSKENNITEQVREAVDALPKELPFSFNDYILKL